MNRRAFLDWLIKISGTALGGFVLYPVIRYMVPPPAPEAATRRVIAAARDELAPGSFKTFPFGAQPGLLVRLRDGSYRAFSGVCTHLECTVQYRDSDQDIYCACHDGIYNLDGKNIAGPPPSPLEQFDVHEVEEEIVVERAKS